MTRLSALLLCCSFEAAPDLPCSRIVVAEHVSGQGECVRLDDANGSATFRLATSEDCTGPACIRACDGASVLVLEKLRPGPDADWTERRGPPEAVPHCAHSALCADEGVWCE